MRPSYLPELAITGAIMLLLGAGCSATKGTGTLERPTWDYITNANAETSAETFSLEGFQPADDTLYAIPLQSKVKVGQSVRIVVVTGIPSHPFSYMTGVSVAAPAVSGHEYVRRSFNVGAPGGGTWEKDGFWSASPGGEILAFPDNFIQGTTGEGLRMLDFNVTPIGNFDDVIEVSGALFNYEATFSKPGVYKLGFVENYIVDRTYYFDHNLYPHKFWGNISNQHAGVPNTVTVTDAEGNSPAPLPQVPAPHGPVTGT